MGPHTTSGIEHRNCFNITFYLDVGHFLGSSHLVKGNCFVHVSEGYVVFIVRAEIKVVSIRIIQ